MASTRIANVVPEATADARRCMFEAEHGSGKKLRVHLKGQAIAQAEAIGRLVSSNAKK